MTKGEFGVMVLGLGAIGAWLLLPSTAAAAPTKTLIQTPAAKKNKPAPGKGWSPNIDYGTMGPLEYSEAKYGGGFPVDSTQCGYDELDPAALLCQDKP